jgi:hypothetical protein
MGSLPNRLARLESLWMPAAPERNPLAVAIEARCHAEGIPYSFSWPPSCDAVRAWEARVVRQQGDLLARTAPHAASVAPAGGVG